MSKLKKKHLKDIPVYLTANEVAAVLKVTPATVRNHEKQGKIPPAQKIGDKLMRWNKQTFVQWLQDQDKQVAL